VIGHVANGVRANDFIHGLVRQGHEQRHAARPCTERPPRSYVEGEGLDRKRSFRAIDANRFVAAAHRQEHGIFGLARDSLQHRVTNVAQVELRRCRQAELEHQRTEIVQARVRILPHQTFGDQPSQDAMHGRPLEPGIFHQVGEACSGAAARGDQPDHQRGALDGLGAGGLVRRDGIPGFRLRSFQSFSSM